MTRPILNRLAHGVILASFVLSSLSPAPQPERSMPAVQTTGVPTALVLALVDTCLGGKRPGDHRPCDKSACHAALTIKRKKTKKLQPIG